MSNPRWPATRHEVRAQDSIVTESQGVLYDRNRWSQRDELEEEELRLRLRIIELQRKRLDRSLPPDWNLRNPRWEGELQPNANTLEARGHAAYPPAGPFYPYCSNAIANQLQVEASAPLQASLPKTSDACVPSRIVPEQPNDPVSIGGRISGWWTQFTGTGKGDDAGTHFLASHPSQAQIGPSPLPRGQQLPVATEIASAPYLQLKHPDQNDSTPRFTMPFPRGMPDTVVYLNNPNAERTSYQPALSIVTGLASPVNLDISEPFQPVMAAANVGTASPKLHNAPLPSRLPPDPPADAPGVLRTEHAQNRPSRDTQILDLSSKTCEPSAEPPTKASVTVTESIAPLQSSSLDEKKEACLTPHNSDPLGNPASILQLDQPEDQLYRGPQPETSEQDAGDSQRTAHPKIGNIDEIASEAGVLAVNSTSEPANVNINTAGASSVQQPTSTAPTKVETLLSDQGNTVTTSTHTDPIAGFDEDETCHCGERRPSKDECYFCWPCNGTIFCKKCWDKCLPHGGGLGRSRGFPQVGLPHEKSDPLVARRIFETLQSECNEEQQALLHHQDEDSSWFGTGKDSDTGETVFRDFGRYSRLLEELSSRRRLTRFPALVSFVGQTGAGKSSLIRLLIETLAPLGSVPEVPVVGSSLHTDIPTSGDVHLYPDLSTFESNHPIFYADCEGLDGGERQPMGARNSKSNTSNPHTHSFTRYIRKQHHTSEREIMWATTVETTSREYHLWKPPLISQYYLPHAIIVLNAFDNTSDPDLWDVDNSTVDLLGKVNRAVHQNHKMRKFAEFWREKGRQIETVEILLLSYYSSIRIVRVPEKGRPTLIHEQVQRLYNEIKEACEKSRESKHKLRMLLNSDELQPYLQHAFDHFCRNLERPFDFVQASLAFHPIPSNFGGNILKMAINIMVWRNTLDGPSIFKELSFLVASCIMLDSARRRNLGTFEKVFGGYVHHCDDVLDSFCNLHWPCEYVHPYTSGRCVNVRAGHQSKGHQLDNGKVMAVGNYQSEFTADRYRLFFEYPVAYNLRDLLQRLQFATQGSLHLRQDELSKAAEIHKGVVLGPFFRHLSGAKRFVNHTACYCCLTCPPEHPLPCGHVLCTPCIQAYGQARGAFTIEMTECPMHHEHADGQFHLRWPVFIKPPGAGVRVLALDGGGIRGIVELTILQHVETQLGAGLPIQAFFDLIVGTSAGGIIALGLGANGWSVAKCTSMFKKLCKRSFEKRWTFSLHGLEQLISFSGRALYETSSIENALQQAFGANQSLFAGTRELMDNEAVIQRTTKVAVTTTTTGGRPALLGNYNRTDIEDDAPYSFPRSENPDTELKVNEAARATSAAPTVFKQFLSTSLAVKSTWMGPFISIALLALPSGSRNSYGLKTQTVVQISSSP